MHETGIAMQIADIVKASLPTEPANLRVESIRLAIGRMSAVVPDSLRFCFEAVTAGTALEGAQLVIDEVPVCIQCQICQHQWTTDTPVFVCPQCQAGQVNMTSGRELDIVSIEVEAPDQSPDHST